MIVDGEVRKLARTIWNYNFVKQPLERSDCIMVLCSHDVRLAAHAARLFREGWAPWILFSGGLSAFTAKIYDRPEAEVFATAAIESGVPPDRILLETASTNTGDNLRNTAALLADRGLGFRSFIFVQKPNMLRRVAATAQKLWPDKRFVVSSHDIPLEAAPHARVSEEMFVHELVGDLQRIRIYPDLGFQVSHPIPEEVWAAYERLVELGFTRKLCKPARISCANA